MFQQSATPDARELTDGQRRQLVAQAIGRLRAHHDGEMYGCIDCYHGRACAERELIRWYDQLHTLDDRQDETSTAVPPAV